jgi:signal transduction histidine kinase
VRGRLDDAVDELDRAIRDIRQTIFALQQPVGSLVLDRQLRDLVEAAAGTLGFRPELVVQGALQDLPDCLEPELLAVVREGLANVVRHARAGWCRVSIEVQDRVRVTVEDDGVGTAPSSPRSGLVNLHRRAERLGGAMALTARRP